MPATVTERTSSTGRISTTKSSKPLTYLEEKGLFWMNIHYATKGISTDDMSTPSSMPNTANRTRNIRTHRDNNALQQFQNAIELGYYMDDEHRRELDFDPFVDQHQRRNFVRMDDDNNGDMGEQCI